RRGDVQRLEVARRMATLATEEAVAEGGDGGEVATLDERRAHHGNPGGWRPGEWAQNTLNSSPIWSFSTSLANAARTVSACGGLALASISARCSMPRCRRK